MLPGRARRRDGAFLEMLAGARAAPQASIVSRPPVSANGFQRTSDITSDTLPRNTMQSVVVPVPRSVKLARHACNAVHAVHDRQKRSSDRQPCTS